MILTFGESDNLITAPDDKGAIRSEKGIDLNAYAEKSIGEARAVGLFGGQAQGIISAPGDVRAPSGSGVRPLVTINAADVAYYKKISDMYRELTGIQSQPPVRRPQGAFFQYGYYQFGVLSFSTPGWGMSAPQPDSIPEKKSGAPGFGKNETKRNKTTDAIMLEWMDREKVNGFAGWQAYEHPDLGDVEIGGFKPYSLFNPPPEAIVRLGENHAAFVSHLATLFAQIKITVPEVVARGGGLFSIKAVVENTGFLPTSLAHGITSRSVKPTMVQIGVNPETILSGDDKTSFIPVLEGSGGRKEFTWLISSKPGTAVEVKAVSQKAGVDRITLILK